MATKKRKCNPKRTPLKNGLSLTATELISFHKYYGYNNIKDTIKYELDEDKRATAIEFARSLGCVPGSNYDYFWDNIEYQVSENTKFQLSIYVNDELVSYAVIENVFRDDKWFSDTVSCYPPFKKFYSPKDFEKICRAIRIITGDIFALHFWFNTRIDLLMDEKIIEFMEKNR